MSLGVNYCLKLHSRNVVNKMFTVEDHAERSKPVLYSFLKCALLPSRQTDNHRKISVPHKVDRPENNPNRSIPAITALESCLRPQNRVAS